MKQTEQTRGVSARGPRGQVTNGFFLIGSPRSMPKGGNVSSSRSVLVRHPGVYNNNRRRSPRWRKHPGERVFADAFRVWKQ